MSGHTRIGLMTSDDAPELGWSFVKFQAVCLAGHPGPGIQGRASARDAPTFQIIKSRLTEDY